MSRDDSRLASVLGELSDLGRRISDRAAELARLVGDGGTSLPPQVRERLADVTASAADLAAATAATAPTAPARKASHTAQRPRRDRSSQATAASRSVVRTDGERRWRSLAPAFVSVALNGAVILGLALVFVAAEADQAKSVITLGAPEETVVDEMAPVEFEASPESEAEAAPAAELPPDVDALTLDPATTTDLVAADASFDVEAAVAPVSFESGDVLAAVGGTGSPSAGSGGGGQPAAGSFFGRPGQGQTVCFLCDNSISYGDGGFHTVLDEVARAVESLRPDQSFFVVFFSDTAYPMFHPERLDALQPASLENKRRLRAWLATVEMCSGGRGIDEAVRLAGTLGADVVYFLSDGKHSPRVVERVVSASFGGAVVHTFGMQQGVLDQRTGGVDPAKLLRQQECDRNLAAIATAHGGTFSPVTVPPQAAMLERIRPIRRNRAPGPVWGSGM
jgi:hypothetical protein